MFLANFPKGNSVIDNLLLRLERAMYLQMFQGTSHTQGSWMIVESGRQKHLLGYKYR